MPSVHDDVDSIKTAFEKLLVSLKL